MLLIVKDLSKEEKIKRLYLNYMYYGLVITRKDPVITI